MAPSVFPPEIATYSLSPADCSDLASQLTSLPWPGEQDDAGRAAAAQFTAARILPEGLLRFLFDFRSAERSPAVVVTGFPVDGAAIGPTPPHWSAQANPGSTADQELFLLLSGSVLGDVFAWSTLQRGRLVQDVLPIAGDEAEQSGHGSEALLEWHTEDGFHPCRCDYLGLMCLRNLDGVPTTFASISTVTIPGETAELLARPLYLIRPDNEHLRNAGGAAGAASSVRELSARPEPTPVLFGDLRDPYLRIDPYFMTAVPGRGDAGRALRTLVERLDENLRDLVLRPGDVCFIDNYRAVHGRRRFTPRYDGTDRWLKKIIVTRDLRKSRGIRPSARARVLT